MGVHIIISFGDTASRRPSGRRSPERWIKAQDVHFDFEKVSEMGLRYSATESVLAKLARPCKPRPERVGDAGPMRS